MLLLYTTHFAVNDKQFISLIVNTSGDVIVTKRIKFITLTAKTEYVIIGLCYSTVTNTVWRK